MQRSALPRKQESKPFERSSHAANQKPTTVFTWPTRRYTRRVGRSPKIRPRTAGLSRSPRSRRVGRPVRRGPARKPNQLGTRIPAVEQLSNPCRREGLGHHRSRPLRHHHSFAGRVLNISKIQRKGEKEMNTKEALQPLPEYVNVPLAELVESPTNPRKMFDNERLEELAESIRSKGVLSPLLARRLNGHFEIVSGARRYRAALRAGLQEVPVRIVAPNDEEAHETQIIENIQRADVHPFEEAQGFLALLEREGAGYTVEKIAAKTGKAAAYIAKRLRLLDLIPAVAGAFTAGHIGIEHALLIAKLGADVQEEALRRCFDGYYAANDAERSLVPVSRLQAWIEQNVYLSLKSVPFSKDDEALVPEAGSCANCPKRTGFNTLLFSEVREDSCADAACFNRT